jgi:UDP-glucose 4-epimerase
VLLRLAGIYGPLYHSMRNLPSRLCHAAVSGRPPDLDGMPGAGPALEDAADVCYVKDCAWAILCIHVATGLRHRVYNVGAGRPTTVQELATAVTRAVPDAQIAFSSRPDEQRDPAPYMDISRIETDTGYRPSYDIAAGVSDYIAWLRHHPQ